MNIIGIGIWTRIFDTSRYSSLVERDRARMIYGINLFLLGLAAIYVVLFRVPSTGQNLLQLASGSQLIAFYISFFYVMGLTSIVITRWGYATVGGLIIMAMWSISLNVSAIQSGAYLVSDGMTIALVILLGGLLNGPRGLILGLVVSLLTLVLAIFQRQSVPPPTSLNNGGDLFSAAMFLLVFAGITFLFLRFARIIRAEGIFTATQDRLKIAGIAARITQEVTRRVSLDELLNNIVERICNDFPKIYHAQIFLIEPRGDTARLSASTGEVGKKLLEQAHSLEMGGVSVIGQTIYQGVPIVAKAGAKDTIHRYNPLLPDTAVEAAFPLRIGTSIIGVLDLQSKNATAFDEDILDAFQTMADNVALAIDNVRQFERAEARIQENQLLVEQARAALREVERLNERLTGRAWSEYLRRRGDNVGLAVDFDHNAVQRESDWTSTMAEAMQFNHFVQEQQPNKQVISIPLRVRGQVVGAMEFELDERETFTPEDMTLIQEVGERFGLAAENTRLVEESQHIALREALVNEISSRLQAASNIESTLTEAARSLRDALKAQKVAIRLGSPPVNGTS